MEYTNYIIQVAEELAARETNPYIAAIHREHAIRLKEWLNSNNTSVVEDLK